MLKFGDRFKLLFYARRQCWHIPLELADPRPMSLKKNIPGHSLLYTPENGKFPTRRLFVFVLKEPEETANAHHHRLLLLYRPGYNSFFTHSKSGSSFSIF